MTNRPLALAALALLAAAPAAAQPGYDGYAFVPRGGYAPVPGVAGGDVNAFFYPNGYDPQYGSQGRVADAADFAADYGCAPVWNGRLNRYVPACN